jgi:DNA-binding transcriptional MerR regulator
VALSYKADEAIRMIQGSLGAHVTYQRLKHLDDNELLGEVERTEGGHRLYSLEQIERATVAIALLELGMEVRWVKALMKEPKIPTLPGEPSAAIAALTSDKTTDFDDDTFYAIDFALDYGAGLELLKTKVLAINKVFSYLTERTPEICDAIAHVTSEAKGRLKERAEASEKEGPPDGSTARHLRKRMQRLGNLEQRNGKLRLQLKDLLWKLAESPRLKT